ncbi:hypothetical protein CDD83_117 [Cordyceps sp. RAO-2017]|nr:hypothetical protein CDD83_117 [Cordyceps sp. RAO-2017]
MTRSDEAEAFFHAVYAATQEIPYGKVTTYGHIAHLVDAPGRARQVGICMKHLPTDATARFHNGNVPWFRVINSKGIISPRSDPSGARQQADALCAEGVEVTRRALGELAVDFAVHGWFPSALPSGDAGRDGSDGGGS